MMSIRQRLKHFLSSSDLVRRQVRGMTNFAQFVHTRNIFAQRDIDLVIDVGANCGQFSTELRSFYKGEILSFEPVSSAFEQLQKCAAGDSNWKCFHIALGRKAGTLPIFVAKGTHFSSFLKSAPYSERFGDQVKKANEELVAIRRLDEVLDETVPDLERRRVFLKIDTQGFEQEVIAGLGDHIEFISAIQSEVSIIPLYEGMRHWTESISTYEGAGFSVAGMFPVTLDYLNVIEFDCLMVRDAVASQSRPTPLQEMAS